jgi:hypothetical protein
MSGELFKMTAGVLNRRPADRSPPTTPFSVCFSGWRALTRHSEDAYSPPKSGDSARQRDSELGNLNERRQHYASASP